MASFGGIYRHTGRASSTPHFLIPLSLKTRANMQMQSKLGLFRRRQIILLLKHAADVFPLSINMRAAKNHDYYPFVIAYQATY